MKFSAKKMFFLKWKAACFWLVCILPTASAFVYYGCFAAPEYVTRLVVGVRPAQPSAGRSDPSSSGAVPLTVEIGSTSFGLTEYLQSNAFIVDLEKKAKITEMFGAGRGDFMDYLPQNATDEQKLRYIKRKIIPYFDTTTGLVDINIKAFGSDDSLDLAKKVLGISEGLINDISNRIRSDALASSTQMTSRILDVLTEKRSLLVKEQASHGIVDPAAYALSNVQLGNQLRGQLIELQAQLGAVGKEVGPDAPVMLNLTRRIGLISKELERLNNSSGLGDSAKQLAPRVERLERLRFEVGALEKQYASALESQQLLISNAEKQSLYLLTFVDAVRPDASTEPKILKMVGFVFIAGILVWAIMVLTIQAVRDHTT